jgi:hypothetical protein
MTLAPRATGTSNSSQRVGFPGPSQRAMRKRTLRVDAPDLVALAGLDVAESTLMTHSGSGCTLLFDTGPNAGFRSVRGSQTPATAGFLASPSDLFSTLP